MKTAKGDRAPARRGAGFRRIIHAGAAHPRPSPRPARRGERARVWASLTPPHTRLEEVERTSIFKYDYLHFNEQCGTKEFPHRLLLT
jgi:hypothetical protein